jgi:hypothetical protein
MKRCSKCNIEKELDEFYKRKDSKDGYRTDCKECRDNIVKIYQEKNYDKVSEIKRKYYLNNKNDAIERTKIWQNENKDKYKEISKKYREKPEVKERLKSYHLENNKNKENYKLKRKEYSKNNNDKINERHRERYKNDNLYKLKFMVRGIIYKSLSRKNYKKDSKSERILGCSFEEFKIYLESKFENWMFWENYGLYNGELNYGWDVDHIIPLSSAESEEGIIKLNHYTNLQPLCSKVNRDIKKDSYE